MEVTILLTFFWEFIKAWWWLFVPFLLYKRIIFLWLWWRQDMYGAQQRSIYLEIKMPQNVEQSLHAMEDVFSGLWQMHDPANSREKWLEGKSQPSFSVEIVSKEGEIHFYMRIPEGAQKLVETAIYSQFPTAELQLAEDYTKSMPTNLPNREWDIWGTNYVLEKPSPYPIKTYSKFFEPSMEMKEEKRVDPIALLIEGLSRLGTGEHIWLQFILSPILHSADVEFVTEGKKIINELAKRTVVAKPKTLLGDLGAVGSALATGKIEELTPVKPILTSAETSLTPGERDILSSIEEKISKYAFKVTSRFMYIAKRENYFSPAKALPMSFFTQFSTATYNNFRPSTKTLTKVYTIFTWFLDKRRTFLRKRRMFRNYLLHVGPFFPKEGGTFVLNIEELATIIHFPGKIVAPSVSVPRVAARKGEAPPNLPTE